MTFKNQRTTYFGLRELIIHANKPQGLRSYHICGSSKFFIDGVTATIRVAIRPPRCRMTGATFKKRKVTPVKHKPAGGIAMPGGLINGKNWPVYIEV